MSTPTSRLRRPLVAGVSAALALASVGAGGALAASAAPATSPASPAVEAGVANGTYVSVAPSRLLDTRTSPLNRPLNAGETYNLKVTGRAGVPASGVRAVVLNLTVTGPTTEGYLTAYPKGAALPNASSINFVAGDTRANLITVPVSSDGYVSIRNAFGKTNVVVDVQGYYVGTVTTAPAGAVDFWATGPFRVLDTRTAEDGPALAPNGFMTQSLAFEEGTENISALALNVTAVSPATKGYLKVWNGDEKAIPATSNLNFAAGQTTPNMVVVPVTHRTEADGTPVIDYSVLNASSGKTNVVVDVAGIYAKPGGPIGAGLRFQSTGAPKRIVDTRTSFGTTTLGSGTTRSVAAPTTVIGPDTLALVMNVTAVKPTANTFLTVWPTGDPRPVASNLNPAAGQVVANMAMVMLGQSDKFSIYNHTGTTNVVIDLSGRFDISPDASTAPAPFAKGQAPKVLSSHVGQLR